MADIDWERIHIIAAEVHSVAWSLNTAEGQGWTDRDAHNRGMASAVVDLVRSWVEPCTCGQAALAGLPYDPGCLAHRRAMGWGKDLAQAQVPLGDSEGGRDDGSRTKNPFQPAERTATTERDVYPVSTRCPLECGGWDEAWHGLGYEPVPGRSHHARGCPEQVIRVRTGDPVGMVAVACEAALLVEERAQEIAPLIDHEVDGGGA